ncbi:hypothetical protein [Chelativorans sp. AA-79]|uniref:hypothetical protein n=1 Tax=Chelativorans sp. AA-79 TaxID=3028735 RepID=UPI0023F6DB6E|nr:hypothetical protein [Chelativorans sp. AA-79]WEX08936.1 hypothetical protein PVE73_23230 [Chelativorans sp. AA-79]
MHAILDFVRSYPAVPAFTVLIGGVAIWHVWDFRLRPLLIPKAEISALADELVAKYGPRAEEMAYAEEDRAWRYSDVYEQGKWRRVRRELWRRYRRGEWE